MRKYCTFLTRLHDFHMCFKFKMAAVESKSGDRSTSGGNSSVCNRCGENGLSQTNLQVGCLRYISCLLFIGGEVTPTYDCVGWDNFLHLNFFCMIKTVIQS